VTTKLNPEPAKVQIRGLSADEVNAVTGAGSLGAAVKTAFDLKKILKK